jgi:hypothetical protein
MKCSPSVLPRTAALVSLRVRKETEIDRACSADLPTARNALKASRPSVNPVLPSDEPALSFPAAALSAKHAIGFAE